MRQRILQSPTESRQAVIASAYAELFSKFPDHEVFHANTEDRRRKGRLRAGMVIPLSRPGDAVLEVGCGRGDVLLELARLGHKCFGIEPSEHMLSICADQKAATVAFGTADRLEFADGSFDLVFSQEVLEHLHPDDVPVHFSEAFRVLRPRGILAVETPNRDTGPQDVSRGFVAVAEGLHLKEWSVRELIQQFRQAGFVKIRGVLVTPFSCAPVGPPSSGVMGSSHCQVRPERALGNASWHAPTNCGGEGHWTR